MDTMSKVIGAAFFVVAMTLGLTATADTEACNGATYVLKSARNEVGDYLRRYASCVSRSNGHDDCSRQFSGVQSAQDAFALAVSDYDRECF